MATRLLNLILFCVNKALISTQKTIHNYSVECTLSPFKHTTHIIEEKCPYTELMNAIEEIKSFIKLYKLTKMDIVVDGAAGKAIVEQTTLTDLYVNV
jgi:hypothetical protein